MDNEVAAIFVDPKGIYSTMPGVDCWGPDRDARNYAGPLPVVAHPPCARWCQLARMVEKVHGYKVGDDHAMFAHALACVWLFGGVLEHPAYSIAWNWFGLPRPSSKGGWTDPDAYGGRACHVEQGNYGHRARKGTWLYAIGTEYPELRWGKSTATAWVSWGDFDRYPGVTRLGKKERSATPPAFAELLLCLAKSSQSMK